MGQLWRHVVATVAMVLMMMPSVAPCSCNLRHPQQHVCEADYVVFARIRRLTITPDGHPAYKFRVKRLVKGSKKVELILQKGLLYTETGTCRVGLFPRTSYVITGKVTSGKPQVTLCSFASPVKNLTPKMKKGFRLLYHNGCDCEIMSCHHYDFSCPRASYYCSWTTSRNHQDCQGLQSMCLRGPSGRCEWLQGRNYRRCMKTLLHNTSTPLLPHRNSIQLVTDRSRRRKIPYFTSYKRRFGFQRRHRQHRPFIGYVPKEW